MPYQLLLTYCFVKVFNCDLIEIAFMLDHINGNIQYFHELDLGITL